MPKSRWHEASVWRSDAADHCVKRAHKGTGMRAKAAARSPEILDTKRRCEMGQSHHCISLPLKGWTQRTWKSARHVLAQRQRHHQARWQSRKQIALDIDHPRNVGALGLGRIGINVKLSQVALSPGPKLFAKNTRAINEFVLCSDPIPKCFVEFAFALSDGLLLLYRL